MVPRNMATDNHYLATWIRRKTRHLVALVAVATRRHPHVATPTISKVRGGLAVLPLLVLITVVGITGDRKGGATWCQ